MWAKIITLLGHGLQKKNNISTFIHMYECIIQNKKASHYEALVIHTMINNLKFIIATIPKTCVSTFSSHGVQSVD